MSDVNDIESWPEKVRQRYENYLKTSFFFQDSKLRTSFQKALQEEGSLLKGPYSESPQSFRCVLKAQELARKYFQDDSNDLLPALIDSSLYFHQERAIRSTYNEKQNIVVATGTASGKTESFLYPILFELYRQHLAGELERPGVRAMVLYPMNALANDQRERLGDICGKLEEAKSKFKFTFGQYIGQTPQNKRDRRRNGLLRDEERLPGELVFRDEMLDSPPHILLTNYSMLEYLLIRPNDSRLFDNGRGTHWQFIVLDEAHQYRGAKGMEMGMLVRRLKERLRDGGRQSPFQCIATSATISSGASEEDQQAVAEFAQELFGERYSATGVIFGELQPATNDASPRRYHAFLRALEGAFLVHENEADRVKLNREQVRENGDVIAEPLEIALCRECGQHYYVGREHHGKLHEAVRDPSQSDFGVDYYIPEENGNWLLCRGCGALSKSSLDCSCDAEIRVKKCEPHVENPDQLKECENCGYRRGGIGDPVQEIVHGSDGPNTVIATALHELFPENKRKLLAFADSRQEAAFFAWYAEDSYKKLRDRNLIFRAICAGKIDAEGLSIDALMNRLLKEWERVNLFPGSATTEDRNREVLKSILCEVLTEEKRLSLGGVGLIKWFVGVPDDISMPEVMQNSPWNFTDDEARLLIGYLLDELRPRRAINLPDGPSTPDWRDISSWSPSAYCIGSPGGLENVSQWGHPQSAVVGHFLYRLLVDSGLSSDEKKCMSVELMEAIWRVLREHGDHRVLSSGESNGTFRLDSRWIRAKLTEPNEIWICDTCATLSTHNIRGICPRNRCPGNLSEINQQHLEENHYRKLYQNPDLPPSLRAEEHTAQIDSDSARRRQDEFKSGEIHLLSSSTTFEVGVDLGDLEAVFLRNVPPEPFNYTQRVGRAGRRDTPGLALTYCRRNPHDLYHYEDPEGRIINGRVRPPRLRMTNEKIILRHMVATALSALFRASPDRFKNVEQFVGDWEKPCATSDLKAFCASDSAVVGSLRRIVPESMYPRTGLEDGSWIEKIAGSESRLDRMEAEVCSDYNDMEALETSYIDQKKYRDLGRVEKRKNTIAQEQTLTFLSRKAVIPKYGFPVDVVELDTRSFDRTSKGVALQRDLSQAIAEYAPGGKVVANKQEWESCGVKVVTDREWRVRHYQYDDARNFKQWNEGASSAPEGSRKYLIPQFGFVTALFKKPGEPRGRARRLYTTRPFFQGFVEGSQPETKDVLGVQITKALPGTLVILCEGKNSEGFYICRSCGAHMTGRRGKHKSPSGSECQGTLRRFSLGHELVTDVVRLQFPQLCNEWDAYSVAYAVLLGAADTLDIPDTDLNVTITGVENSEESAILLYDNVPGGAGLVEQLENESTFDEVLNEAKSRVSGACGCDSSCYGCLRSFRNQFAHSYLNRKQAWEILNQTDTFRQQAGDL